MEKNKSLVLASVIFGVIALVHLIRSIFGWSASIASYDVPVYFSYIFVVIACYLAWHMYNASKD